jgi:two-component system, LuxR family, response regulator FixJ
MVAKTVLHIVDNDIRCRAAVSHLAFTSGYHAEIYSSVDDLLSRSLGNSMILVNDSVDPLEAATGQDRVRQCSGLRPTIAFSLAPDAGQIVGAVLAGALDYLELPIDAERLRNSIQKVQARAISHSTHAMRERIARVLVGPLSDREKEVLDRIVDGQSNKHIARFLSISPRTVEIHRANVISKIGARNTADAVRIGNYAMPSGAFPAASVYAARAD